MDPGNNKGTMYICIVFLKYMLPIYIYSINVLYLYIFVVYLFTIVYLVIYKKNDEETNDCMNQFLSRETIYSSNLSFISSRNSSAVIFIISLMMPDIYVYILFTKQCIHHTMLILFNIHEPETLIT